MSEGNDHPPLLDYSPPQHRTIPLWAELVFVGCVFLTFAVMVLIVTVPHLLR